MSTDIRRLGCGMNGVAVGDARPGPGRGAISATSSHVRRRRVAAVPSRRVVRVPIPPGAAGVTAARTALAAALAGGPPIAPVPVPTATVSADYVATLLRALRPGDAISGDDLRDGTAADDVAVVVATSGSTGDPRGVLLPAGALRAVARGRADRSIEGAHYLAALPVTSIGGLQVVTRSLLAGTEPVALPSLGGAQPFAVDDVVAAISALAERAAGAPLRTSLVPAQLARLLDDPAASAALAAFDEVLIGGAAMPPGLLRRARDAGVAVVRTYGMTETAGGCVYDGVPLPDVRIRIGDGDEIALGGPVLAAGYRGRPDETARRFAGGWFATGDVGQRDGDGRLAVTGRRDDIVQVRGTSVSVVAVQSRLGEHPAVADAAVVAVGGGAEGVRLVAYVVPAGPPVDEAGLRTWQRAALGSAAVPREWHVVDALPTLPGGKVDRDALRRRASGDGV